ncbi:MAG: nickel insertion protein [Chloroflexota bacterium]|nr:nickel insertion protein [Chloroflexota bacterium]
MLLLVNVDDISGEMLPHVIDGLMARGAGSVHAVQALTKKARLEYLFWIDAPEACIEELAAFLVSETGTLGLRVFEPRHIRFEYRIRQARLTAQNEEGDVEALVRVKEVLSDAGELTSVKAECDDLRTALARFREAGVDISFAALKGLVEQLPWAQQDPACGEIRAEYPAGRSTVPGDAS